MAQTFLLAKNLARLIVKPGQRSTAISRQPCGLQHYLLDGSPFHLVGPGRVRYRHSGSHSITRCLAQPPPQMELDVSQHRSPFLQLPLELLLQIWEYLSVDDALSLRLVCHCIEALLFEPFCREFFSERRFSITHHSLQVLIDITRCPRLKNCLTHLTIGFDRLHSSDALPRYTDYWDPVNNTLRGSSEPLVKAGIDPYKLEAFTLEQNFLVSSGQFLIMLSEALGNLTCLKELSLRDHNARRRITHAGMNPLLLSYGWSHILRETGIDFTGVGSHLDSYDDRFVDIVFSAILLALARGQTQIDALTVEIRQGTIGLSSSAFSIPVFFYRDIHPTLFNLRSLDLSVSFTQVPIGSYSNPSNNFLRWQKHQLFSFLQQTPNLSTLRVNSRDKGSYEDGIIEWLAKLLHAVRQDESREDNRHIQHGDHSKTVRAIIKQSSSNQANRVTESPWRPESYGASTFRTSFSRPGGVRASQYERADSDGTGNFTILIQFSETVDLA